MSGYSYTITNDTVSVVVDGEALTVRRGADNFEAARKAVLSEDWSDIKSVLSPGLRIEKWLKGRFAFVDGHITYMGERIDERTDIRLISCDAGNFSVQRTSGVVQRPDDRWLHPFSLSLPDIAIVD